MVEVMRSGVMVGEMVRQQVGIGGCRVTPFSAVMVMVRWARIMHEQS